MVFGIDFDGTFSKDPVLFRAIVGLMWDRGHTPIMVTQRCAKYRDEILEVTMLPDMPLIFASGMSKREAANLWNWHVDVWIEDNPVSVVLPLTYSGCP